MAFRFSNRSLERLNTCDPALQSVMKGALRAGVMDFTIVCGHRGEAEQNEAYQRGTSTLRWPHSRHNTLPSTAVDIAPWVKLTNGKWGIPWEKEDHPEHIRLFEDLSLIVLTTAGLMGVDLEWGGYWKSPVDRPHYQLKARKPEVQAT